MPITEEIFQAFLNCETKSYFKFTGTIGLQREFSDWQRCLVEDYKQKSCTRLCSDFREGECLSGTSLLQVLENNKCRFVINCIVQAQEIQSRIHALERVTSHGKTKHNPYIPIRFVPSEKITKHDKLLLAFDALILFTASGKMPRFGKIIHGSKQRTVKVQLAGLIKMIRSVVERIAAQQVSHIPPPLILNKHCAECEFQTRCRQIAIEKDELSLLSGMTEKERKKQHGKGIFSVTQLSYTFRPRRKPKRSASKPNKYYHALKALAIREGKIHIVGRPELNITRNPVYLDVEGDPDRNFYYLIGLRVKSGDSYVQHSFWANDMSEEKDIWASFLETLSKIEDPQIIHYGGYETVFLKRMKERYPEVIENHVFLDQLIAESLNVLSVIYARIYFPTYSNSLKEVAQHLGFQWSDSTASGLNALRWRYEWECSGNPALKHKLVTYNAEDCEAVERVVTTVAQLCRKQIEGTKSSDKIIHTDSLKCYTLFSARNKESLIPEFKVINAAAYWNYQRERIYMRSGQRARRTPGRTAKHHAKTPHVNQVIEFPPLTCCRKCKSTEIYERKKVSKIVYDLKFGRTGVRRWIVKCLSRYYSCHQCGSTFRDERPWTGGKLGPNTLSYVIHQTIELRLAQRVIADSLKWFFAIDISYSEVNRMKSKVAQLYKDTYEAILSKIVNGSLIHADETKVHIIGKSGYVWVLTNHEEVAYLYTETREGNTPHEILKDFKGVLVSDFYAAYDSIDCPQQKCLIHLLRDLDGDFRKQPLNDELKELVHEFATLLKTIVETIDRFGLKSRFLRKHKVFVDRFYKRLSRREYKSEIAAKYKKRFEKYRDRLFTFLDYDNIPWNNNNAEHAIKAFARLRQWIRGLSTEKGINDYLILLSICETCKYKGVSFLDFLRSGKKDINMFIKKNNHVSRSKAFRASFPNESVV